MAPPHRSAGRSPKREKTENQLLTCGLTWAMEDGAQGNINIYENIRT